MHRHIFWAFYFPIQKSLKITSKISSLLTCPVICPIHRIAIRKCCAAIARSTWLFDVLSLNLVNSSKHSSSKWRWRCWLKFGLLALGSPHLKKKFRRTCMKYSVRKNLEILRLLVREDHIPHNNSWNFTFNDEESTLISSKLKTIKILWRLKEILKPSLNMSWNNDWNPLCCGPLVARVAALLV